MHLVVSKAIFTLIYIFYNTDKTELFYILLLGGRTDAKMRKISKIFKIF